MELFGKKPDENFVEHHSGRPNENENPILKVFFLQAPPAENPVDAQYVEQGGPHHKSDTV